MANGLADDIITATCLATRRTGGRGPGHGRRHVRPSGHRGQRGDGCASSATRSWTRPPACWPRARWASAALSPCRSSWRPWPASIAGRPVRQPDPSARPPARAPPAPRTWPAGTSSSAPAAPRSPSTRCASSATARAAGWASPSRRRRCCVAPASRSSRAPPAWPRRRAPTSWRRRRRRRCARPCWPRCPAATRSSWPPRWPTSGRAAVAPAKLARSEGLRLELEPTADILAEAAAMARDRGRPGAPAAHRGLRGGDRLARARARRRPPARAWTCSWPTTSRSPAPASARRPTASPSSCPASPRSRGRRPPRRRSPTTCSTACCACGRRAVHHWR